MQGLHNLSQRLQPVYILADCVQACFRHSSRIIHLLDQDSFEGLPAMLLRILRMLQGSLISSALIFMVLFTTYTADHIRACESPPKDCLLIPYYDFYLLGEGDDLYLCCIPQTLSTAVCCLMSMCLRSPDSNDERMPMPWVRLETGSLMQPQPAVSAVRCLNADRPGSRSIHVVSEVVHHSFHHLMFADWQIMRPHCLNTNSPGSQSIHVVPEVVHYSFHLLMSADWQIMQPQPPVPPADPFAEAVRLPPPGSLQDQTVLEASAEDGSAQGTPAAAAREEASSSGADFDLSTWGSDEEEVSSSTWNSRGSFSRAQVFHLA